MGNYLIKNVTIVNEGKTAVKDVLINGKLIKTISSPGTLKDENNVVFDGKGKIMIPGVIDDHVHFREPGLTHKGDIASESGAAVAGGITSIMEMPNTIPQTTTIDELNKKNEIAAGKSHTNYSFYLGVTNNNISEIKAIDPGKTCGIKVFLGASTGNMLADNKENLERIFAESPVLIAAHCEDETTIQNNLTVIRNMYGENISVKYHPVIRSEEACFLSTSLAVNLAKQFGSRLHVCHLSTGRELQLFESVPLSEKRITTEVSIHHLMFCDDDYSTKGNLIKINPAIKKDSDRKMLFQALLDNKIDIIATDHAPHTLEEKSNPYFSSPSGAPMIQHSLVVMLEFWKKGLISIEKIVEKMCHNPAQLFNIHKRGFIREGFYADLTLIDPESSWIINKSNLLYKCGWSPLENETMQTKVDSTFINGELAYSNDTVSERIHSMQLKFDR